MDKLVRATITFIIRYCSHCCINDNNNKRRRRCTLAALAAKVFLEHTRMEKKDFLCLMEAKQITESQSNEIALLPSALGGGIKNVHYKSKWMIQFDHLISTGHYILNTLFKDVAEIGGDLSIGHISSSYAVALEYLRNPMLQHNQCGRYLAAQSEAFIVDCDISPAVPEGSNSSDLAKYLSNTCRVLCSMLLGNFPAPKYVAAGKMLELIARGLTVSNLPLEKKAVSHIAKLLKVLPAVHISLLKVLSALFVCGGRSLVSQAVFVANVLMQALHATCESPSARLYVYSALSNWMVVAKEACYLEFHVKELLPILLQDMLQNKDNIGTECEESIDKNEIVGLASVKVARILISTIGFMLAPEHHKLIQCRVISEITNTMRFQQRSAGYRVAMYHILEQLCLEPGPRWAPPTQFALPLLVRGCDDRDTSVAASAASALSVLQRVLQPEYTIATFPIDYNNVLKEMQLAPHNHLFAESKIDVEICYENGLETEPIQSSLRTRSKPIVPPDFSEYKFEESLPKNRQECESHPIIKESIQHTEEVPLGQNLAESHDGNHRKIKRQKITNDSPVFVKNTDASPMQDTQRSISPIDISCSPTPAIMKNKSSECKSSPGSEYEVDSPMSLRSGTLVCKSSAEVRRRTRERDRNDRDDGSIKSQSLPSSPVSTDADADSVIVIDLFNDSIHPALE